MPASFAKAGPPGPTPLVVPVQHDQGVPSSSITISHGFGRPPVSVVAYDGSGAGVWVSHRVIDDNTIEVTTDSGLPFSGKVLVI